MKENEDFSRNGYVLFFDNAKVHLAQTVKQTLLELSDTAVTNAPYYPEANFAEIVIRLHKNIIRQ
jgi:hypothetical protein